MLARPNPDHGLLGEALSKSRGYDTCNNLAFKESSLAGLIARLEEILKICDGNPARADVAELRQAMSKCSLSVSDWERFAFYDENLLYTRNLVHDLGGKGTLVRSYVFHC